MEMGMADRKRPPPLTAPKDMKYAAAVANAIKDMRDRIPEQASATSS